MKDEIVRWLKQWEANHDKLSAMIRKSPRLEEIGAQSDNLFKVSAIGLQALEAIASGKKLDASWPAANLQTAKAAWAETELMIVPSVEKLVQAVK